MSMNSKPNEGIEMTSRAITRRLEMMSSLMDFYYRGIKRMRPVVSEEAPACQRDEENHQDNDKDHPTD